MSRTDEIEREMKRIEGLMEHLRLFCSLGAGGDNEPLETLKTLPAEDLKEVLEDLSCQVLYTEALFAEIRDLSLQHHLLPSEAIPNYPERRSGLSAATLQ